MHTFASLKISTCCQVPNWSKFRQSLTHPALSRWSSSQLINPNKEGFYYRGFMGSYTMRLLWRGQEVGEVEVQVEEDKDLVCTLNSDMTFVC